MDDLGGFPIIFGSTPQGQALFVSSEKKKSSCAGPVYPLEPVARLGIYVFTRLPRLLLNRILRRNLFQTCSYCFIIKDLVWGDWIEIVKSLVFYF